MSRVQLALNVSDLDKSVEFYSKLFDVEPAKQRPGYANFAVDDPRSSWCCWRVREARAGSTTSAWR